MASVGSAAGVSGPHKRLLSGLTHHQHSLSHWLDQDVAVLSYLPADESAGTRWRVQARTSRGAEILGGPDAHRWRPLLRGVFAETDDWAATPRVRNISIAFSPEGHVAALTLARLQGVSQARLGQQLVRETARAEVRKVASSPPRGTYFPNSQALVLAPRIGNVLEHAAYGTADPDALGQAVRTIAHEFAHSITHRGGPRLTWVNEGSAEIVARMRMQQLARSMGVEQAVDLEWVHIKPHPYDAFRVTLEYLAEAAGTSVAKRAGALWVERVLASHGPVGVVRGIAKSLARKSGSSVDQISQAIIATKGDPASAQRLLERLGLQSDLWDAATW